MFLYIRVRTQERVPTALQGVFIVSAYIAALNSKEIAVVGAGWLLAYEVLFHRPRKLLLPLILSVLALIYTAGKLSGSESLARLEGYAMEVSLHRFVVNNLLYASQMLHTRHLDNGFKLMAALGALTLLCWMLRKPQMWWCGFLICTANLPLSFEIVSRGGASLYLPLFGWALLPGIVITSVWRSRVWRWRITALAACGIAYMTLHPWKQRVQMVLPTQNLTWSVISQIRDLGERPVRHSKIIFLNDPFPEYDTYFIAQLVWNDPTLQITLGNKLPQPPSPQELEAFNWVLAFDGGRCVIIKAEHP